jgi:hypothetical protein
MKRIFLLFSLVSMAVLSGCYDPSLGPFPFVCGGSHGNPECPEGYSCYGGQCLDQAPACYDSYLGPIKGDADRDFEPNNVPKLAYTVICGDEVNPYCPQRYGIQQQYVNLVICGEALTDPASGGLYGGDRDYYRIYLSMGESIAITLKYNYQMGKDLDMRLLGDEQSNWAQLKMSQSTNDDEQITHAAEYTGWHYIEIKGKTPSDNQFYALQWTLTAAQ